MMLDSHRSGTLKAIDLLVIETEQFTLILEGDIDFSKYNRFVEEQDFMTLNFRGINATTSIQIYDVSLGKLVHYEVGQSYLPVFFENGNYMVIIQPKTNEKISFYHEYKPFRDAISYRERMNILSGTLYFQNEVGLSSFEILSADRQMLLEVTIEIFPTKLDYKKDYKALIHEVNEEIYNLAYHFVQRTYLRGSAKVFKDPSLTEFYRLLEEHFEKYEQAITQIERVPHHQLTKEYEEVHGNKLRRQDSFSRSYLRKNASRFVDVEQGIELFGRAVMPKKGLLVKKRHTVDTHENRYVKWTMERLNGRLQHLQEVLLKSQTIYGVVLYGDVYALVKRMEQTIRKLLNKPFWREIGKLDRTVDSLVLQMAPGYREVYQIYTTLSQSIILQGELYKMSIKNIAILYEYWTFLKLGQIVGRTCKPLGQDVVQVRRDGLFVNLDASKSAKRTYKHPVTGEEILLTYQYKTHNELPTVQQIPDTMLSIGKKGKDYLYQYVFDAKYRIDFDSGTIPGPKQDDINTMHRYRDSIVVESGQVYERTAFGAYVLFPWGDVEGYKNHSLYKSIEKVNIGGLPFLPNATELVEEMIYNLLNRSADELQREGILPIGAKDYVYESVDELVLLVKVSSYLDLERLLSDKSVAIKQSELPGGWEEVCAIAIFVCPGIAHYAGVKELGQVLSYEHVLDEIVFTVDSWGALYHVVDAASYDLIEPILIVKHALLDARCFPEMLISSIEARQIWNVLKQLSDEVMVVLDSHYVTRNSLVQQFVVAGISLRVDWVRRELYVGDERIFDFSTILNSPYLIYKDLKYLLEELKLAADS